MHPTNIRSEIADRLRKSGLRLRVNYLKLNFRINYRKGDYVVLLVWIASGLIKRGHEGGENDQRVRLLTREQTTSIGAFVEALAETEPRVALGLSVHSDEGLFGYKLRFLPEVILTLDAREIRKMAQKKEVRPKEPRKGRRAIANRTSEAVTLPRGLKPRHGQDRKLGRKQK